MVQGTCQHHVAYTRLSLTPTIAEACTMKQCTRESKWDSETMWYKICSLPVIRFHAILSHFICNITTALIEELFNSSLLSTLTNSTTMKLLVSSTSSVEFRAPCLYLWKLLSLCISFCLLKSAEHRGPETVNRFFMGSCPFKETAYTEKCLSNIKFQCKQSWKSIHVELPGGRRLLKCHLPLHSVKRRLSKFAFFFFF